jgi:hypothetical protein
MATEEYSPILDRAGAIANAQPLIDVISPLLVELVNHATWAFRRMTVATDNLGGENEDVASLISYRHLVEVMDGVEVLVRSACTEACIPLLRAAFEASLTIDYVMADQYARRSLAWMCVYAHRRIDRHRLLDNSTESGRELADALSREFSWTMTSHDSQDSVQRLQRVLQRPSMAAVEAEYQRLKIKSRRKPEWFQLFDGPPNRRQLARAVGREAEYLVLYAPWSASAHGTDAAAYLRAGDAQNAAFSALRSPHQMQFLANMTVAIFTRATQKMIQHFRCGEDLSSWYVREIKPAWERLRQTTVVLREDQLP